MEENLFCYFSTSCDFQIELKMFCFNFFNLKISRIAGNLSSFSLIWSDTAGPWRVLQNCSWFLNIPDSTSLSIYCPIKGISNKRGGKGRRKKSQPLCFLSKALQTFQLSYYISSLFSRPNNPWKIFFVKKILIANFKCEIEEFKLLLRAI